MEKTPLYDPHNGVMRIAGFMSGSGTNLRRILEYERELEQEVVVGILAHEGIFFTQL